jgi:hypothetical protein
MAAVLLTLKNHICPSTSGPLPAVVQGRSMSGVVIRVSEIGKSLPLPSWGRLVYCTRCDHEGHVHWYCSAYLTCQICSNSGVRKNFATKHTHKTIRCLYQFLDMPPRDY